MRAEGYSQLGKDEKEILACGNCFNNVSHEQLPRYATINGFFLPASAAEFGRVEHDRGASCGHSIAFSTESRNNLIHCSEKICLASNQCARQFATFTDFEHTSDWIQNCQK